MENKNEILITQFIDNELTTPEKIDLVNCISEDKEFAEETVSFLEQEMMMEQVFDTAAPKLKTIKASNVKKINFTAAASFTALAASLLLVIKVFFVTPDAVPAEKQVHRFVLHMPSAENVSVAGTFSGWKNLDMKNIPGTGYWQLEMPLENGEHQYTFIVDGQKQIADPTVPAKQKDDFGGENSVLKVGNRI